jgi:hypothetical protein
VDSKGDKLNGNVKKMVEYEYDFWGYRNWNRVPFPIAIYTYDEKTNQEYIYHYLGDSIRYSSKDIFKFDKDKLIEHDQIQKNDTHGKYLENDSTCWLVTYQYNDNGKLSEEVNTFRHKHSSQHRAKTDYLYDKHGNVIEKDVYYHRDSLDANFDTVKNIFKYDSMGHVIQKDYYSDNSAFYTTCKYKKNYRYAEEHEFNMKDSLEWNTTICRYDDRMNLIKERSYCMCNNLNNQYCHFKYKYDDKGNWVERTDYQYGKKNSTIKRVITY